MERDMSLPAKDAQAADMQVCVCQVYVHRDLCTSMRCSRSATLRFRSFIWFVYVVAHCVEAEAHTQILMYCTNSTGRSEMIVETTSNH